jgi:lipopolysaccharide export system protein LptC
MKKKKSIIISILLVAAIAIIIFGMAIMSKNVAKAPIHSGGTVSSSTTSTATSSVSVKINLSTSTQYTGPSFSLIFPDSWTRISVTPFSIDTFKGQYEKDGAIPLGGAEIAVVTTTVSGPVKDIMTTELMSAKNITMSTVTVNKISCDRASYENTYTGGSISKDVAVYCLRGTKLWKIYLSYHAEDTAGSTHVADLNGILASMKFLL